MRVFLAIRAIQKKKMKLGSKQNAIAMGTENATKKHFYALARKDLAVRIAQSSKGRKQAMSSRAFGSS